MSCQALDHSEAFLIHGIAFASAELAGQRGGGDVAVNERKAPVNGPVVLQAGEGQNLFDVLEVAPTGKGEDLFQIVIVKIVDHGGRPLLLCRDY